MNEPLSMDERQMSALENELREQKAPSELAPSETACQPRSLALATCSADWQAQCDALIEETRKNVAMPSDACVMLSLAAKVLLARREVDRLRKDSEVLTAILDVANPPTGHGKQ